MKIGIYAGGGLGNQATGGAYTFNAILLHALARRNNKHEYVVFADEDVFRHDISVPPALRSYERSESVVGGVTQVRLHSTLSGPYDSLLKKTVHKGLRFIERLWVNYNHGGLLERAMQQHGIELMWCMTQASVVSSTVPYLYTVWDLQHRLQPFFPEVSPLNQAFDKREKLYAKVIPQAAYVIASTIAGREQILKFYNLPEYRVKIIPIPVPDFALQEHTHVVDVRAKFNLTRPFLFYPAQFWPHKNHVVLVKALKVLEQKYGLIFDLVFTGSDKGNNAYIRQFVEQEGLQDRVHFLGFVSTDDLVGLYKTAFALTFASYVGPMNIPLAEAWALGCPVVVARVEGTEEEGFGDVALLFDPSDHNALAAQVARLYADDALRTQLIAQGKKFIQHRTTEDYLCAVENIIDSFAPIRQCWSNIKPYVHP